MVKDKIQRVVSTSSSLILKQEVIHSEEKPFAYTFLPFTIPASSSSHHLYRLLSINTSFTTRWIIHQHISSTLTGHSFRISYCNKSVSLELASLFLFIKRPKISKKYTK